MRQTDTSTRPPGGERDTPTRKKKKPILSHNGEQEGEKHKKDKEKNSPKTPQIRRPPGKGKKNTEGK